MNKTFAKSKAWLIFLVLAMPIITASLGTFKQNDCVDIKTILNTTSVNISTISNPNSTLMLSNKAMSKNGLTFNYTFCNTSVIGKYIYDYFDIEGNVYVNDFEITTNGEKVSLSNIIIVIAFLIISIILFILGYSFDKEKYLIKTGFYLFSLLMALLSINSARIIASESANLSKMSLAGLILIISVICLMFVYVFITWTINTFKQLKNKEGVRWQY